MLYKLRLLLIISLFLANTSIWAAGFQVNNDGTVTDLATGLIWQQDDGGASRSQFNAINHCNGLTFAGSSNWRLPTIKELSSITDYRAFNPAIDRTAFPGVGSIPGFWSASSLSSDNTLGWYVNSSGAVVSLSKSSGINARCVR